MGNENYSDIPPLINTPNVNHIDFDYGKAPPQHRMRNQKIDLDELLVQDGQVDLDKFFDELPLDSNL